NDPSNPPTPPLRSPFRERLTASKETHHATPRTRIHPTSRMARRRSHPRLVARPDQQRTHWRTIMTLTDRVQTLIEEGIPYDVIHLGISRAHYDTITKQEAHEMVYQFEDG